ncbi:hypothetical protein SDJN02_23988, partial [Cucurbita argyrosperma subsp. argyrosperma]
MNIKDEVQHGFNLRITQPLKIRLPIYHQRTQIFHERGRRREKEREEYYESLCPNQSRTFCIKF